MAAAATPPAKRKPSAPMVATWVRVELNKRLKRHQLLQDVPGVVSRVNEEDKTVNVLYPNKLSVFFHDRGQSSILFAIETHPVGKVFPWEGPTKHLEKILIHALLHFTEARAPACKGSLTLRAVASPQQSQFVAVGASGRPPVDASQRQIEQVKLGLKSIEVDNDGDLMDSVREPDSPAAEETPARASSSQVGALDDGETPPKIAAPAKPAQDELPEFTKRVSEIFRRLDRDAISKQECRSELAQDFPNWEALMARLDSVNKVCVVEDAVMLIQ